MASVLVYLHNAIAAILAEKNPSGIELNFPASISFNLLQSIRTLHTWVKTIYALTAIGGPKDSIRCLTFRKDERKSKKESKIRCFLNSALSNTDWCQNLVNLTWTVSFPRPQSSGRGNWAINLTLCATKPTDTEGYGCRFPPRILCVGYNKISVVKIDFRTDPRKFKLIVKGKRNASTFRGKRPLTCANTKIALVNIPCFLFRFSPGSCRSSSSGMISFPSAEISKSFLTLRLAAFLGSEASGRNFNTKAANGWISNQLWFEKSYRTSQGNSKLTCLAHLPTTLCTTPASRKSTGSSPFPSRIQALGALARSFACLFMFPWKMKCQLKTLSYHGFNTWSNFAVASSKKHGKRLFKHNCAIFSILPLFDLVHFAKNGRNIL